ncbi:permease prefix domain 1-containing protein [Ruminococcaceae bacterium OttesenSCG-928-A11]|nr:permease prefix domain 1-containing protein [Ruminococcaceae bacterium OttesenSCG-928-A11]
MDQSKVEIRNEIRREIELLFADAPKTRAAWELQEELLANCMERYDDLTRDGMESNEAVRTVVGSIGDVNELIGSLPDEDGMVGFAWDAQRRRNSALTVTIAVGLYILAGVTLLLGGALVGLVGSGVPGVIGVVCAGVLCIIPTCMLVYNAYRYPKYERKKDTVVENFKQWNNDSAKAKSIRGAISSMLWTLTVVVYLLTSFLTGAWHITWIMFLVSACLESAITLFFKLKELSK